MKNLIYIVLAVASLVICSAALQIDDQKGIARVQKILGKEVYVLSEPLKEYEVVERLTTGLTTLVVGRQTIQKQMQEVINRADSRVEKGKTPAYDGVLTDDGDVIVLIKFK